MTVANAIFPNTITLHAYDLTIAACDDCKLCHHTLGCKYHDDIDQVLKHFKPCDHLIIVSPIYFGALTDQLLKLFNRFQMLFEAKFTHQKPLFNISQLTLISTCAAKDDSMFAGATLTRDILASLFDSKQVHTLLLNNTDEIDDILITYEKEIVKFKKSVNPWQD